MRSALLTREAHITDEVNITPEGHITFRVSGTHRSKKPNARALGFFVVGEDGFGPSKSVTTDLQSAPFGHSGIPPYDVRAQTGELSMELVNGVEPSTC